MPAITNFGGRQIVEPGSYGDIKGKVPVPPITTNYGNIVLIDTGIGAGFGGGSGIAGTLKSGSQAIYPFTDASTAKRFVRGGMIYSILDYLFTPSNAGQGAQKVYIAQGTTTTPAKAAFDFNALSPGGTYGKVSVFARAEGTGGNGVNNTGTAELVSLGYGMRLKSGIYNQSALIIEFYEGQFRGLDVNGVPYDGINQTDITANTVVATSIEFTTTAQLLAWMTTDPTFNQRFAIDTANTVTSALTIGDTAALIADFPDTLLFTGGTTSYNSARVDDILSVIPDLDNSMFLCLDYGGIPNPGWNGTQLGAGVNKGAMAAENVKILAFINATATDENKAMYVGGNYGSVNLTNGTDGSIEIANFYNSSRVVVIHDKVSVPSIAGSNGTGFAYIDSIFAAAMVCGRAAGFEPQINMTFKDIRISGVYQELKKSQREQALLRGVLHFRNVDTLGWVVNQGINSKQTNAALIYNDGTSPEISVMRIFYQLNRDLRLGLLQFCGGNLANVTGAEIIAYMNSALQAKCANIQAGVDGLILGYNSVTATLASNSAAWRITYCFYVNGPVNQMFSTGFALDPALAANVTA